MKVRKRITRRRKGSLMITQTNQKTELRKLEKRREVLRHKLKSHFSLPVSQRNYREFESVVDELDEWRKKVYMLKAKQ